MPSHGTSFPLLTSRDCPRGIGLGYVEVRQVRPVHGIVENGPLHPIVGWHVKLLKIRQALDSRRNLSREEIACHTQMGKASESPNASVDGGDKRVVRQVQIFCLKKGGRSNETESMGKLHRRDSHNQLPKLDRPKISLGTMPFKSFFETSK
jgi:hypothetical protein